jgi:Tol biopolymer transport system component
MTAPIDADRTMLDYFVARSTSRAPDGLLDSALTAIDSTRQRPAWRSVGWWVSPASADQFAWHGRRVALVAVVGLLIAMVAALAVLSTSGHHLPPPFGPARPGSIVMEIGGDIYLAGPDGGNRIKLYAGAHWDGHATFSPDGTKIAFESALDDKSTALMVMGADGTGPTTLISGLAGVDDVIAWSPDSRRVAIGARRVPDPGTPMFPYSESRIIVGDAEHGTASFVGGSDLFGNDPRWSPDGSVLVFGRCCSGPSDGLWSMRPDGSDQRRLSSVTHAGAPAWSPDGTQIAFLGDGVDGDSDLYLVGADGSGERKVTDDPGDESFPVWSPDGTKLVFPRMLDQYNKAELHILDVTGGRVVVLHGKNVTYDQPVWSPDGAHILAYAYSQPDNPQHASEYDALAIFDVTDRSKPVVVQVAGLRTASWQRLAP